MPVKPEPPDVLYVTESGDGQMTATALPPSGPDVTSQQPIRSALPPPPSLVPRPQMPPAYHPAALRMPPGAPPGPPPMRMPPGFPMSAVPLGGPVQPLPNGHSNTNLPQGQFPQMVPNQPPSVMPGQMCPLPPNGHPLIPGSQALTPGGSQPTSPVNSELNVSSTDSKDDKNDDAPDSASRRGIFGWSTVAKENIPVLFRKGEKHVAVRMVEFKLLSRFPNMFPEHLKDRPPLHSFYATSPEVKLLNEINYEHCDFEFGHEPFSTKDLVVKLKEFEAFYEAVERSFPKSLLESMKFDPKRVVRGGWVQINNTVVPYLYRHKQRFVPLKVIRYAATLAVSPTIDGDEARQEESDYLNHICKDAGISFDFDTKTRLVSVDLVSMLFQPVIQELPTKDPFQNAKFVEIPPPQPAPPLPPLHGMSNMMNNLPYAGMPPNAGMPYPMPRPPPMPPAQAPSSAGGPPISSPSQVTLSECSASAGNPVTTAAGLSPDMRVPSTHPMGPMPCPRHPGSYMYSSGRPGPVPNMYFHQYADRFPVRARPPTPTGLSSPSTSQPNVDSGSSSLPTTSPQPPFGPHMPTTSPQPPFGPHMIPPGHRGYMRPPFMYPGHMMPPYGLPYTSPPEHVKNQEHASTNRRRRSSENRSRGSTPVQHPLSRRSSGEIPSPSALSRSSSTDSLNTTITPSAVPSSLGEDTPGQTQLGDQNVPPSLPAGTPASVTLNPPKGPKPPNSLPILNVPMFSPSVRSNYSHVQPSFSQNASDPRVPGFVYRFPENSIPRTQTSSFPPSNTGGAAQPVTAPSHINDMAPRPASSGECLPTPMNHAAVPVVIKDKEHFGVVLPTMYEGDSEYVLIEDVVRQCFPQVPVSKFVDVIENVLGVVLQVCSVEIERLFVVKLMRVYGQLQCPKLISIKQLDEYLPQLKYMFKENVSNDLTKYFDMLDSQPSGVCSAHSTKDKVCEGDVSVSECSKSVNAPQAVVLGNEDEDMSEGAESSTSRKSSAGSSDRPTSAPREKQMMSQNRELGLVMDVEEDSMDTSGSVRSSVGSVKDSVGTSDGTVNGSVGISVETMKDSVDKSVDMLKDSMGTSVGVLKDSVASMKDSVCIVRDSKDSSVGMMKDSVCTVKDSVCTVKDSVCTVRDSKDSSVGMMKDSVCTVKDSVCTVKNSVCTVKDSKDSSVGMMKDSFSKSVDMVKDSAGSPVDMMEDLMRPSVDSVRADDVGLVMKGRDSIEKEELGDKSSATTDDTKNEGPMSPETATLAVPIRPTGSDGKEHVNLNENSAKAKAENLVSSIAKVMANRKDDNCDKVSVTESSCSNTGTEQSVEERVIWILCNAQKLKSQEEKILENLTLSVPNGANENVQTQTPKIVKTVSLAEKMKKIQSIQKDVMNTLSVVENKPDLVENVTLSEVEKSAQGHVETGHGTDSRKSDAPRSNEEETNSDGVGGSGGTTVERGATENCANNAFDTMEVTSLQQGTGAPSDTSDISSNTDVATDDSVEQIVNRNSPVGEEGSRSAAGSDCDCKSPIIREDALPTAEGTEITCTKDSTEKDPNIQLVADQTEKESMAVDSIDSSNSSDPSSPCMPKLVGVVSLSELKRQVDSPGLWDNWDTDSNKSKESLVVANQDSKGDTRDSTKVSSVEQTDELPVEKCSSSVHSDTTELTSAEPMETQSKSEDSSVRNEDLSVVELDVDKNLSVIELDTEKDLSVIDLDASAKSESDEKQVETVTILDSSTDEDVIIVSNEKSPEKSSCLTKLRESKSSSRVPGVLAENEKESFLKIVSVVGSCDVPVSGEDTSTISVKPSEDSKPTVLSVGSCSKIVISPSSSQKFHVSMLDQKKRGLKRCGEEPDDQQPSKRIMIKVENNNNPVKEPTRNERVIIQRDPKDGTEKHIFCID